MKGLKTVLYGLAIALIAVFSSADVQAFIADYIPQIGGAIGFGIVFLRAITSSSIFSGFRKPKIKPLSMLAIGLVLPLMLGCSIAKQADTPLKKWAVAQEAHTAASDSLIGVIQTGQIDKPTAVRIDNWLDHAQDVLNAAITFISAGEDASALTAILEATSIINSIMEEIESVTARNSDVIPWPHVSRLGLGGKRLVYYRDVGGIPGPRSDAGRGGCDPGPCGSFKAAA